MGLSQMQIGEVAERTGLSLRTIRYYEEVGIVTPSARSQGGFRLYAEADVSRLMLVKRMKPLDFSLDEMRDLLGALDALESQAAQSEAREELIGRLEAFRLAADERCKTLLAQLTMAEEFAASLRSEIRNQRQSAGPAR